eukprot:UN28856
MLDVDCLEGYYGGESYRCNEGTFVKISGQCYEEQCDPNPCSDGATCTETPNETFSCTITRYDVSFGVDLEVDTCLNANDDTEELNKIKQAFADSVSSTGMTSDKVSLTPGTCGRRRLRRVVVETQDFDVLMETSTSEYAEEIKTEV